MRQTMTMMFAILGATDPSKQMAAEPFNHSPEFMLDEAAMKLGVRSMLQVPLDRLAIK